MNEKIQPRKIEMNARQLASLNLLIGAKQSGAQDIVDDVTGATAQLIVTVAQVDTNLVGNTDVTQVIEVVVPAVVAATIGANLALKNAAIRNQLITMAKNLPLEHLITLRNNAIVKG